MGISNPDAENNTMYEEIGENVVFYCEYIGERKRRDQNKRKVALLREHR